MNKTKILLYITIALLSLSACHPQRAFIMKGSGYISARICSNKDLLALNDSAAGGTNNICLFESRQQDKLDFSLLKPEVAKQVQVLTYESYSVKKINSQLAYFPDVRRIDLYIRQRHSSFVVDSSFSKFQRMNQLNITARDSLTIQYLPDSLRFLGVGSRYLSFPFVAHPVPLYLLGIDADSLNMDFGNFQTISQHAEINLILKNGIVIDSLYNHLRIDSLRQFYIYIRSKKVCRCSHSSRIPYVNQLGINDKCLGNGSCKRCFSADSVNIYMRKKNYKNYTAGQYNDIFVQPPAYFSIWDSHKRVWRREF